MASRPHSELLDVLSQRFLARDGTPWQDIEELERQAYALVKNLEEQLESCQTKLADALQGWAQEHDEWECERQERQEQLETEHRHRLALAEWIVKNQPEKTWSEEVQELAILLNDEHGKVFELQEQLEATQDALDRALNILKDDGYESDPDFGPAYREMAATLDSNPASGRDDA